MNAARLCASGQRGPSFSSPSSSLTVFNRCYEKASVLDVAHATGHVQRVTNTH